MDIDMDYEIALLEQAIKECLNTARLKALQNLLIFAQDTRDLLNEEKQGE